MGTMSEQERRDAALAAMGGEVLAAREVPSKDVLQMLSVRMEPDLIGDLREVAKARGMKVSELIRDAAARVVFEYRQQQNVLLSTWTTAQSSRIVPVIVMSASQSGPAYSATYQQTA